MNIMFLLVCYSLALYLQHGDRDSLDLLDNQVKNAEKKGQNSKYPQVKKNLHKDKGCDISKVKWRWIFFFCPPALTMLL